MVERYGVIDGVGAVSRENPRQDFLRSPYWTDGNRAVLEIARQPVELENIRFFSWDWSFRFRPINDE
jgi:hypothetical protein